MSVKTQLEEYCNCVDVNDKDVDELINLISSYTCWTEKVCDTFLSASRREVLDLPSCVCDCDVFTYTPYYEPFDQDSFTFMLITQDGTSETETELTDYVYSSVDENFRIVLPIDSCGCSHSCGCDPVYKLLVTYTAGYEEIPECLLPIFCEALQWIKEKNTCDCSECIPCNTPESTEVGEIDYSKLTGRIQDYFLTVLTTQYMRQLSLISLCGKRDKRLWGIVV